VEKIGWKNHTKVKDIFIFFGFVRNLFVIFEDYGILFPSINIYSLKPLNFGF